MYEGSCVGLVFLGGVRVVVMAKGTMGVSIGRVSMGVGSVGSVCVVWCVFLNVSVLVGGCLLSSVSESVSVRSGVVIVKVSF